MKTTQVGYEIPISIHMVASSQPFYSSTSGELGTMEGQTNQYPNNAVEVDSSVAINRSAIHNQLVNVARRHPPDRAREFTFVAACTVCLRVESWGKVYR